jgi:hypothetical protein
VLRSLHGSIADARLAHPDVLHVDIRDPSGGRWRLATQDAEWSPSDPSGLLGRSVEGAAIDEETGELHLRLSDGARFAVTPAHGRPTTIRPIGS